jgi:hypothetical protein
VLKNSSFLEIAEIWGIENVYPSRESRFVALPIAKFFRAFSGE